MKDCHGIPEDCQRTPHNCLISISSPKPSAQLLGGRPDVRRFVGTHSILPHQTSLQMLPDPQSKFPAPTF